MDAEMIAHPALAFAARRWSDGSCPVTDETGRQVASVAPAFFTSRFTATDAAGEPLCAGGKLLLNGRLATAPDGAELVRLRPGLLSGRQAVRRGATLTATLLGRLFSGTWRLEADGGRVLLQAQPDVNQKLLFRDAWIVGTDSTLTLAEIVSVVELHRLDLRKRRRRDGGG